QRLERPELAALHQVDGPPARDRRPGVGKQSTAADPLDENGDVAVGQLPLGRHLHALILVPDGADQQALLRLAGDDRRSTVSAFLDGRSAVELQPAALFLRLCRVTLVTIVGEQRTDLALEELTVR